MSENNIYFKELCEYYIYESKKLHYSERTLKERISIINSRLITFFNEYRVNQITTELLSTFQQDLLEKNYSERYRIKINSTLSRIINYAKQHKYISNDVKMYSICLKQDLSKTQFWNVEEYDKFITQFDDNIEYKTLFTLIFEANLLQNEVRCLKREDINQKNKTITVSRILVRHKYSHQEEEISLTNTRIVQLSKSVFLLLSEYMSKNSSEYLFHVSRYKLSEVISLCCQRINIRRISLHAFYNNRFFYYI